MSKKVYIFLADGFEDIEGLTVVDLMRRADIDIKTVSIKKSKEITTSHGITMLTDLTFAETDFTDADMLVLPGGATLALQDMKQGEIEVDKGLKARQTNKGLVYDNDVVSREEKLKYNTLKTPRGGEFRLTLSDGTSVILNSATNLRYPVTFGKQERKVYLDGEAYFEVQKDSTRPFYVEMDGMQIKVYGTSFNVNTHKEGGIQTVLVEGRVGIKLPNYEHILSPGSWARFNRERGEIEVRSVDVQQYVAWTKGIFAFEEESLEQIMNTLSLWYDVDVFYQTESVKHLHFSGHLGRYKEIQDILDAITEATGVKFTIKERIIIVTK